MKVKFILPALTESKGKYWRPIKYSLFPPLGLATLAGYLDADDEAEIIDEHVESINLNDSPDLVAIEVYITAAHHAYAIADHYRRRGIYVIMGGLHVTALPHEAARHADTIVLGPAEEAWPRFLHDFRRRQPHPLYQSLNRTLEHLPPIRRDLIKRKNYLVPNSIVVSRGCPHSCDFCYKDSFFRGGRSFYTYTLDQALREIQSLTGRHLFFLDDNIFGSLRFAHDLFREMIGYKRLWQGAATVEAIKNQYLLKTAAASGLRSLFIGFESLNQEALRNHNKHHNKIADYEAVIHSLHDLGIMINASFVFGLEEDNPSVFETTVEWAIKNGIETATFHILTPYPGTALYDRYLAAGRIRTSDWNLYDTRHAVFQHPFMSAAQMENGYWQAYHQFYSWNSILRSVSRNTTLLNRFRHLIYTGAWKKCEWLWAAVIHLKKLNIAIPILETVLKGKSPIVNFKEDRQLACRREI
ncbi:MAG: B12-binding domain-containing radical SAM protein [Deltaproteobacteria bacterium]|nr:B12-binding domain-containing radical SAM protein [Deltaproteobacteria bacterium]